MAAPIATTPRVKLVSALAAWMPLIAVLAGILFAVAGYFLILVPKIQPLMSGGEFDFSAIKAQLADDQAYITKMKDAAAGFSGIAEADRQQVGAIIPLDPDIPGLLVQIDEIARANKLALQSIDTAVDEKNVSPLGRKTARVSVSVAGGDYEQFKLFLADLERSMRLFDVTSISFAGDGKVYGLVLKTYFMDRKAPAAKK